jgi:tRNA-specific 2-thiouridylase
MSPSGKIAVAMSGGVDSSVAAALLAEQGHEVFGVMIRLWVEPGGSNRCCSPQDVTAARRVAALLHIPFYVLDMQAPFHQHVVEPFLRGYAQGLTPNPCMECNRHVRWSLLLGEALSLGADQMATGHYARVQPDAGDLLLLRGTDPEKDQSYVLSVLNQEQLRRAVFPLGDMTKAQVRDEARRRHLPVAERSESQDLCFLGGGDYREFLSRHLGDLDLEGPIADTEGRRLGTHSGLAHYTIGQRKGIGLSAPQPLYVVHKDVSSRTLTVGPRSALGRTSFDTSAVHWIAGRPPRGDASLEVQVRYRAPRVACRLMPGPEGGARVELVRPLPDVTPGQSAVFYCGDVCLGSGVIAR